MNAVPEVQQANQEISIKYNQTCGVKWLIMAVAISELLLEETSWFKGLIQTTLKSMGVFPLTSVGFGRGPTWQNLLKLFQEKVQNKVTALANLFLTPAFFQEDAII